jgi:hypothetical protein
MAITITQAGQNATFPTISPWTGTATLSPTIASGEGSLVCIQYGSQTYPPVAISDSAGNSYTVVPGTVSGNAADAYALGATSARRVAWYFCESSVGTITSVTVYNGGVSNVAQFRVFKITGSGGTRDANANWNTGSLEALGSAQTNDLVVTALCWSTGNASSTLTTTVNGETWTDDGQMGTGGSGNAMSVAHAIATGTGNRSARWSSVAGSFGVATAVIKPAVPPTFTWTHTVSQG